MFRFHHVEIVHWDFWQRCTIPLNSEIVTVVGPNGSGKTTLLDALRTLLAIPCSSGRDYKRYVRRANRPYAWLRALVTNPRRSNGQLAFWPVTEPQVTLLCQVRKKGGEWERRYGIAGGTIQIEQAETSEHVNWVGVRQYESQLESAGLTRAIKRVLSLDQGHTDKLCEYSGRQLLELVFQVFGDQEVLDNYQHARQEQTTVERELNELQMRLAQLGTQLEESKAQVRSYEDYQRLITEIADLQGQWLPRVTMADLAEAIKGSRRQIEGAKRDLSRMKAEICDNENKISTFAESIKALEGHGVEAQSEREKAQQHRSDVQERLAQMQALLQERERLQRMAREQASGIDAGRLADEAGRLREGNFAIGQSIQQTNEDINSTNARIAAHESGRTFQPLDVASFRNALNEDGLQHVGLAETIEITREDWRDAVEAVLRPVRHLLLLEHPQDAKRAWQKGEELQYRHYIVADGAETPPAPRGTLAECVRFHARVPEWLTRLLNEIQCVENVEEGARLPQVNAWITRKGYYRGNRGGRYIGVEDYFFGKAAVAQLRARIPRLEQQIQEFEDERRKVHHRLGEIDALIAGIDAAQALAARAQEFNLADSALLELNRAYAAAVEQTRHLHERLTQLNTDLRRLERERGGAEVALSNLLQDHDKGAIEHRRAREEQFKRLQMLRSERRGKPRAWLNPQGLAEAKERYGTRQSVLLEIERLEKRRGNESWVKDPGCVDRKSKFERDYQELSERIDTQRTHLQAAQQSTDRARGQYINVLKATLRRYAENIRRLGELAEIEVSVEYPILANDDATLAQASLEIRFDFDQKGPMGLNDGEASGGQQVMKSMILLVGLMMDDSSGGGFVFIDEPFAHLDIFNIDKVGAFLQATRAQYILTTPNTHNVNVFKPSDLTLVTQKRRPNETWAAPIAFLRRAREVATAK